MLAPGTAITDARTLSAHELFYTFYRIRTGAPIISASNLSMPTLQLLKIAKCFAHFTPYTDALHAMHVWEFVGIGAGKKLAVEVKHFHPVLV